ncbi:MULTISPECIES: hypothetical protein [Pseudoalteromonas]
MSKCISVAAILAVGLLGGCGSTPVSLYSDNTMKKKEYNGINTNPQ